jgi:NADPH:quinone reductase-like Zn-dependent oxidoreductase
VVRAPRNLGDEAATLPIAALTAWRALQEAEVAAGEFVLILGSGGVSMFALQFAVMQGARAIVVARGEDRVQKARELGAAHVIDRYKHPSWSRQVIESTGGHGADIVMEVVGRSTFGQSSESLAVGGRIAVLGYVGGTILEVDVKSLLIGKRARLLGQTVGSRLDFDTMNRAIESHGMTPLVDQCHELDDLRSALERVASGDALGKVIVRMPR